MSDGKWGDLGARVVSAIVMLAVGAVGLWLGGIWFTLLVAAVGGGMIWELGRMIAPEQTALRVSMGALTAAAIVLAGFLPGEAVLPVLVAPAIVGASQIAKDRWIYAAYAAGLMLACFGITLLRNKFGIDWVVWLILVVVATDVAGYFVGRVVGGPKFWPKVSPKKTWSGTAGGWVAAGIVGAFFGGPAVIALSLAASFCSQMGDAAESAIKRRTGVKDSSNLIPGHGGLLDRFDGMMGAALLVVVIGALVGLP